MEGCIIVEKPSEKTREGMLYKTLSKKGETSQQVSLWEVFLQFPKKTELKMTQQSCN